MGRRIFFGLGSLLILSGVALLIWQPDSLKTELMRSISREISHSTPYELSVGHVSGNIFTGFSLNDVRVFSKAEHQLLL